MHGVVYKRLKEVKNDPGELAILALKTSHSKTLPIFKYFSISCLNI